MNQITIGVVGSGLMGVGIATQAALHGYATIVHDIDAARLASVHAKAEAVLELREPLRALRDFVVNSLIQLPQSSAESHRGCVLHPRTLRVAPLYPVAS